MRLIDADLMAVQESEAYLNVNTRADISPITKGINSVVHRKVQKLIADTPTIESEPVRHGRWVFVEQRFYHGGFVNLFRCSECSGATDREHKYCPNCGAKMDGDSYD